MKPPQPPELGAPPSKKSLLPVFLAGLAGVAIAGSFTLLSGGFFAIVLIIAGLIFGLVAFHYLVWGWWLSRIIEQEEKSESKDDQAE